MEPPLLENHIRPWRPTHCVVYTKLNPIFFDRESRPASGLIATIATGRFTAWCNVYAKDDFIKNSYLSYDGPFEVRERHIPIVDEVVARQKALANNHGTLIGIRLKVGSLITRRTVKSTGTLDAWNVGKEDDPSNEAAMWDLFEDSPEGDRFVPIRFLVTTDKRRMLKKSMIEYCNKARRRLRIKHPVFVANTQQVTTELTGDFFLALRTWKARAMLFKRLEARTEPAPKANMSHSSSTLKRRCLRGCAYD
jgi:hypothetical protein